MTEKPAQSNTENSKKRGVPDERIDYNQEGRLHELDDLGQQMDELEAALDIAGQDERAAIEGQLGEMGKVYDALYDEWQQYENDTSKADSDTVDLGASKPAEVGDTAVGLDTMDDGKSRETKEKEKFVFTVYEKSIAHEGHPERNEDSTLSKKEVLLFGGFDGMGGHAAGDVASRLAKEHCEKQSWKFGAALQEEEGTVKDMLLGASRKLLEEAGKNPDLRGMGATASVVKIWEGPNGESKAIIGNIGDSRVYLLRGGKLEQITLDDNQVFDSAENQEAAYKLQVELNESPEPEILARKRGLVYKSNVLTQNLGSRKGVEPNMRTIDIKAGDKIIITSDGIHDNLRSSEMEEVLNGKGDVADALVGATVKQSHIDSPRTKEDDMTALVIEVGQGAGKSGPESAKGSGGKELIGDLNEARDNVRKAKALIEQKKADKTNKVKDEDGKKSASETEKPEAGKDKLESLKKGVEEKMGRILDKTAAILQELDGKENNPDNIDREVLRHHLDAADQKILDENGLDLRQISRLVSQAKIVAQIARGRLEKLRTTITAEEIKKLGEKIRLKEIREMMGTGEAPKAAEKGKVKSPETVEAEKSAFSVYKDGKTGRWKLYGPNSSWKNLRDKIRAIRDEQASILSHPLTPEKEQEWEQYLKDSLDSLQDDDIRKNVELFLKEKAVDARETARITRVKAMGENPFAGLDGSGDGIIKKRPKAEGSEEVTITAEEVAKRVKENNEWMKKYNKRRPGGKAAMEAGEIPGEFAKAPQEISDTVSRLSGDAAELVTKKFWADNLNPGNVWKAFKGYWGIGKKPEKPGTPDAGEDEDEAIFTPVSSEKKADAKAKPKAPKGLVKKVEKKAAKPIAKPVASGVEVGVDDKRGIAPEVLKDEMNQLVGALGFDRKKVTGTEIYQALTEQGFMSPRYKNLAEAIDFWSDRPGVQPSEIIRKIDEILKR